MQREVEKELKGGNLPVRLLQVTPRYPPYMGGVENHVYQVARRFAAAGNDVTVLTTDLSGNLPADEDCDGVKVRRVPAWPRQRDYYLTTEIYPIIQKGNWEIVHLQSYLTLVAPLAMLAAWRARIPYVVTFHGGGHSSRFRNMLRAPQAALLRPLLARADRLVATARFEIGFFGRRLGIPPEKFVYIPNGADISRKTRSPRPGSSETLIASIGRLEQYKGHQHILAALPYLLEKKPQARLWIAGEGPYEEHLRRMAINLGVSDRVEIRSIPAENREAMAAELGRVALMTLLSEYETHPMAALEALAAGCQVLVADTSGLRELAEKGWARSIPLHSAPERIAAAVIEQLDHPLAAASLELPSWDECAQGLLELYHECIRKRAACVS